MNSLNVALRIKKTELKHLIEKLQQAKLEVLFWENHFKEILQTKDLIEIEYRKMRDEGRLKYAKIYDEHLLFLEKKQVDIQRKWKRSILEFEKIQNTVKSIIQERKKFEKLQKKRSEPL